MSLISFIKEAGEKLFGKSEAKPAPEAAPGASTAENTARLNETAGNAIEEYIAKMDLRVEGLDVSFDGATATATVSGVVPDQQTREKVILCCGNVQGVAAVNDMLTVKEKAPEAQLYTVVKGDTLSKISKQYYNDPNKYQTIFEANKPMLKHPDKIYPGQVLRIPPAA